MIILVKNQQGAERAINMEKESWETIEVPQDESRVLIHIEPDVDFELNKDMYEVIKRELIDTRKMIDLTQNPA